MAQSNSGKYKAFADGEILFGPGGSGQNLNDDLQKNFADEVDAFLDAMVGDGVIGSSSWAVSVGSGLSVNIAVGGGVIQGQIVRSSGTSSVGSLPASTSGIIIYASAAAPWSPTLLGWPLAVAATTGALTDGQLHLATVATDGSGVTNITDHRRVLTPVGALTDEKNSRARQASFGVL